MPAAVRADRSAGAVLASAVGDALGAPYEFGPALAAGTPVRMTGGGGFGWAPGEWTDDTQMAVAILTALAHPDTAADPLPAIEQGFRDWYRSGPADVGTQTRQVLGTPPPTSLAEAAAAYRDRRPDRAAGNGSLMRTGPVALAHPDDPGRIAALARSLGVRAHPRRPRLHRRLRAVVARHRPRHPPRARRPRGRPDAYDWGGALVAGLAHVPARRRPPGRGGAP